MRMNISIQLDESDISLLELLGAILGEEAAIPVVPDEPSELQQVVDTSQITVEEVEVTTSSPIVEKESETPEMVCKACGATETSQWRIKTKAEGPLCNACYCTDYRAKAKKEAGEIVEKREKEIESTLLPLERFLFNASEIVNRSQYVRLEHHGITELSDFAKQDPRELLIIMGLHERHIRHIESLQMKGTMLLRSQNKATVEVDVLQNLVDEGEVAKRRKKSKVKKNKTKINSIETVKRPKWTAKMNTLKNLSGYVWTAFCAVRPKEQGVVLSSAVYEQTIRLIMNKHDFGKKTSINEEGIGKVISKLFNRIVTVMESPDFLLGHSGDIPNGGVYIMKLTKRKWPSLEALKTEA